MPLKEAQQITGRSHQYLRKISKYERRLPYVQDGPHARLFFWESDLLNFLAAQTRRAVEV